MENTRQPWQEQDRLAALKRYKILDTPPEIAFDNIVKIAAQICDVPIALISLVDEDRQWFKAAKGLDTNETPREIAFCDHAIRQQDVLIVADAAADGRFSSNPLVTDDPHLRFYAGAPLETSDGFPLGTLCVLDRTPRELTDDQVFALKALAHQVMIQIEYRWALEQKRASEERNRLILESATDYGIISMDLNGLVTSWNEGAHRIFGWSEQEMFGRPCDDFFTTEDRANGVPEREMGGALTKGRGSDERWHLRKDRSRFWASGEMMPLTNDTGEPIGFIKIVRDRTAQRQAEHAVKSSETRTQLAIEATDLGIWEAAPDLEEFYFDERSRDLLGHLPGDAVEYNVGLLSRIHLDERIGFDEAIRAAVASGGARVLDEECRVETGDKQRWVRLRGRLIPDLRGRPRFVGTIRDVSDEKAAEKNRRLLVNELEHRGKNTMAIVQAIVNQSFRGAATAEDARANIGERLQALSRAHDILTRTNWTAVPIGEIVHSSTQLYGGLSGRITASGPHVLLNARTALALSLALHELCTNAAKYGALSDEDGRVDIKWSIESSGDAAILDLTWRETDGPTVLAPKRKGFGSRLIEDGLAENLGGKAQINFGPEGVTWQIRANLRDVQDSPLASE